MAEHIDLKFINLISSRLERYRVKNVSPFKANFRCPYCLDSKKSRTKSRGWFLEKDNSMFYYCHNCFASKSFRTFLKEHDHVMYNDYVAERFMSGKRDGVNSFDKKPDGVVASSNKSKILFVSGQDRQVEEPDDTEDDFEIPEFVDPHLKKIKNIADMDENHPAVKYVMDRQIPEDKMERFYYVSKFRKWVNTFFPKRFPDFMLESDEPRLIIPFCDETGKMFGFTGRSFDPNDDLRYMTFMIDENSLKYYGLDHVDFKKEYYVFEGAIDSLFVDNSIAMAGADADFRALQNTDNMVIVYDNEPRNNEIHSKMERDLDDGYTIFVWPESVREKDVNKMITSGELTSDEVCDIITNKANHYSGMMGKLKLNTWKKKVDNDDKKNRNVNTKPQLKIESAVRRKW